MFISWLERYGIRKVPSDYALFVPDQLVLSKSLMGKLEADEWEGFLAASLIYRMRMARKRTTGFVVRVFVPFFAFTIGGIIVVDRLLASQAGLLNTAISLVLASSIVVMLVGYVSFFRYLKQLWFAADSQATLVVGKEKLAAALRKLESIQSGEERRVSRFTMQPSVAARLSKIQ